MRFRFLLLFILVLVPSAAESATLNVPQDYSTIALALSAALSGDTVLVGPGTYTQNLNFNGKSIALRSSSGPQVTNISVNGGHAVILGGAAEISGFTISGAVADFGAAIAVSGKGTLIKGNIFQNNIETSGGYGAAIGGNAASPKIDSNLFVNNQADGQYLSGAVSFINSSSPIIQNNVFYNNPTRAINFVLPSGNSPLVVNNTFVGNTVAIKYGSFSTTQISNNILAGNGTGFLLDYPYELPVWDHNLVDNNGVNYSGMADPTGSMGNLSADPRFMSSTDFHLQSSSPAINAGTLTHAPSLDFDGRVRSLPDIGAYEFVPEPSGLTLLTIACAVGILRYSRIQNRVIEESCR
jgi:serine protease